MSRDGSGNYTIPNTFTAGTTIVSDDVDANFSDIATALTASIAKDGQTTPSANLPMGNFRHTGVGAAAARTDYARAGETQASLAYTWATVGGTADVITLTTTFAPAAYAAGQTIRFAASGNNTTTVTVNWNSLGAKALKTQGAVALAANDLISGRIYMATYDGTDFRLHGAVPSEGASGSITTSVYTQNTARLLGRTTASAGAIEEITVGSPLTFTGGALDIDTSALVPTGAITTSGLTMATARLIGRTTASTGAPEEISVGTGLTLSGGSLTAASKIAQVVTTTWATATNFTDTIPLDDTIPQNTEGAERFTLSITPTNASSTLIVDAYIQSSIHIEDSTGAASLSVIAALFRDTTANALGAAVHTARATGSGAATAGKDSTTMHIRVYVSAGSTSLTTFKVRTGMSTAIADADQATHNAYASGAGGDATLGGVMASSMTITEVLP